MLRSLTLEGRQSHPNILVFYLLTIILHSAFISSNWIFYWTRFMTYGQLGLVDALAFGFGLFMEIPTGAVSDLIGKRRTLLAAMGFASTGMLMMAFANGMTALLIGFLLAQIGWAFYSGAAEAMAYDTLKERNQEHTFEKVVTVSQRLGIITVVITALLGGLLYNAHYRLPHVAWSLSYVIGFVACWFITEPKTDEDSAAFSLKGYFDQLSQGFRQLARPALRPYVLLIFALMGIFSLFINGLVQPALAVEFGFFADEQAVLVAVMGVLAAVSVGFVPMLRRRLPDHLGLTLLTFMMGLAWLLAALPLGFWGVIVLVMVRVVGEMAYPWFSVVINREIPSKFRSTTLSTVALMTRLPYVVTAVIAGQMIEAGQLWLFNLALGLSIMAVVSSTAVVGLFRRVRG
ncbi:MAG: hypothetical protein OHK0046_22290 [Anaerolineae bacterium]